MTYQLKAYIFLALLLASCSERVEIPKPRAYPRVELPDRGYVSERLLYCPLTFDRPVYSKVIKDNVIFGEQADHECWFDLHIASLNATIHCSYQQINSREDFDKYVDDSFKLANEHVKRADYIEEIGIENELGVSGLLFMMDGPTATPAQFFLTDTTDHFFRASLYLNTQVNLDSTAPITDFLMQDMEAIMASLEWQD